MQLRDYQNDLIKILREAYAEGSRWPLVALATGGGKTIIFCHVAQGAVQRGNRVLILVHRVELLKQCSRALTALGVPHGLIAPGFSRSRDAVQVGSIQTVARRLAEIDPPDLIVMDEAHHACAGSWATVRAAWPDARGLGVTATPIRLDGRGLGEVFDRLLPGMSTAELTRRGFLSPCVVYAPPMVADLAGLRMQAGDFARGEMGRRVDRPSITGDAMEHYARICPHVPAIAFCASVEHAEHVAAQFSAAGFTARSIDGSMEDAKRAEAIADLGAGRMDVLTSCDIVSEGTDIPIVGAAILLRPTQSLGLYMQQVGRVLRPAPGKTRAVILDHVGNVMRHGLPEEEREWSLAGRPKKRKGPHDDEEELKIRACPKCYAAHAPAPKCPYCGHVYEVLARVIEQVAGELAVLDQAALTAHRAARKAQAAAKTLEELRAIERERGYRPGWARHIFYGRQRA